MNILVISERTRSMVLELCTPTNPNNHQYDGSCSSADRGTRGRSRLLKRGGGGTTKPTIIVDVGLAGIFTLIVRKAHRYAKHASTRGVWGHALQEILKNYTF